MNWVKRKLVINCCAVFIVASYVVVMWQKCCATEQNPGGLGRHCFKNTKTCGLKTLDIHLTRRFFLIFNNLHLGHLADTFIQSLLPQLSIISTTFIVCMYIFQYICGIFVFVHYSTTVFCFLPNFSSWINNSLLSHQILSFPSNSSIIWKSIVVLVCCYNANPLLLVLLHTHLYSGYISGHKKATRHNCYFQLKYRELNTSRQEGQCGQHLVLRN